MFLNYYDILKLPDIGGIWFLKLALKREVLKLIPELNFENKTLIQIQYIHEAFLILNDADARSRYDRELEKFNNQPDKDETYEIYDFIMKKWILNARSQSVDLTKQTLKELNIHFEYKSKQKPLTPEERMKQFLQKTPDIFDAINSKISVGDNFLQPHPKMERRLALDEKYVIVNRDDWEKIISFFDNHIDYVAQLDQ